MKFSKLLKKYVIDNYEYIFQEPCSKVSKVVWNKATTSNMLKKKLFESSEGTSFNKKRKSYSPSGDATPDNRSEYFSSADTPSNSVARQLLDIRDKFNIELNKNNFLTGKVKYIYNPTEYAKIPHEIYTRKYCQTTKKVLFVGMNPGPFGMCQTGVPFGDTNWIKNWVGVEGPVDRVENECPNRPILGFDCTRKEQSGDRFWGLWSDLCGTPEVFFKNAFVYNYCPLAFMDVKGLNLTPADIKNPALETTCDQFYLQVVNLLRPEVIVAIGRYIEKRSQVAFKAANINIPILCMCHPSPRVINNNNWPEKAKSFLEKNNLMHYFQ